MSKLSLPDRILFPELGLLPTQSDQNEVIRAVRGRLSRWCDVSVVLGGLLPVPILVPPVVLLVGLEWVRPWIGLAVCVVVGWMLAGLGSDAALWLWRRPIRRFLREELANRGIYVCRMCGYDLRGQTEPRCPECGVPFDPSLLNADAHETAPETSVSRTDE